MNRRDFLGQASTACLLTSPLLSTAWAQNTAAATPPREGVNYARLPAPAPVSAAAGKIEVIEFFSYGCIHCYNYYKPFKAWVNQQPDYVEVKLVPVGFNPTFIRLQRLYYTLQAMGQLERLDSLIFSTIFEQKNRLDTDKLEQAFLEANGVNYAQYQQMGKSFGVVGKQRQAQALMQSYKIEGTPTIGIHGRFRIDMNMPQGPQGSFAVMDHLIAQLHSKAIS